jgi:hypothetical protein
MPPASALMARRSSKLTSKTITAEHVALLATRDGLDIAAAKRQARRYAKELTGAQTASAVFSVLAALSRLEKQKERSSD